MASGRVLLAVIVSLIASAYSQASGSQCSLNPTTGLRALNPASFETLKTGTTASFTGITANAKTTNAQAIEAFAKGKCQKWGVNAGDSGYLGTQSLSWTEWDLRGHTGSVSVILKLTGPQSTDLFSQRLTIVSVLPSVTDANKCQSADTATFANWNCEAFITDSCQGYEVTDQKAWTFVGGLRYIFIFDSPQAANVVNNFHLDMVPRGATIGAQDWETGSTAVSGPSGTTAGALPGTWARSSRAWDIFPTFEGRISIPGWAANLWPLWNGPSASTKLIGELGVNIIMNIPNWIPGQGSSPGVTCQTAGQEANCNHSDDSLYSPAFPTVGTAGTKFQLEIETFWYDGTDESQPTPSGTATIWVSATGGSTANDWTLIYTVPSLFNDTWGLERIEIPVEFSDLQSVFFKFNLASTDNKLGWAMNTISVVPEIEFDLCADTLKCTADKCSNYFETVDDGYGGNTYTPKYFGCYNPSDEETCENKAAPGATCKTWVCNDDESLDSTTTPAVDEDGCEAIENAAVCNDNVACTKDSCDATGICHNDANDDYFICTDGRGCTRDRCLNKQDENWGLVEDEAEGCWFEATCDDEVACTVDTCETAAIGGDKCLHTIDFNLCEDNIDCTYELICDPEQPGMDPISGCIRIPMDEWCDDNDACTIDTCQPLREGLEGQEASDKCFHDDMNCDDCIECTVDSCEAGECVNEAEDDLCDDHVECTRDFCNKELGKCQNIPIDDICYEQVGVTGCDVFVCRPNQTESDAYGCIKSVMECDDDLACTKDTCVDEAGEGVCQHEANDDLCDDELVDGEARCTDDYCDKNLGKCLNVPNSENCEDDSVCTVNFCGRDGFCYFPEIDISDDIYCTVDACDPITGITHEAENDLCIDDWACTDDTCDTNLGGCTNIPNDAFCATAGHSKCSTWVCNIGIAEEGSDGCVGTPIDCDDGIPCTYDTCNPATGLCEHEERNDFCVDGLPCTDDVCSDVIGCINTANNTNCNDDKLCTIDICGCDGQCYNEEIVCDDNIPCTEDYCDPADGECKARDVAGACDDDIACTVDTCDWDLGQCTNIETDANCPSSADGCYVSECSIEAEGCVPHFHHEMCDDHIPCTFDECTTAGCVHTEMHTLCNDGLDCTYDQCDVDSLGCVFLPMDERCDDFSNCTTHICSTVDGCVIVPDHGACNDGIDCTEDVCDSPLGVASGCSHYNRNSWCDDGIGCTDDVCTGTTCEHNPVHSLCDDGWECSKDDTCVEDVGCVYDDSTCPWFVSQDPLCLECTTSSAQILQLNYTDGTGAMQFATRDAETDELKANIVALPTDQVIIGGASQAEVRVGSTDGLVINDNIRLVPLEDAADRPECNEIRRGSIIVVPKPVACGSHTCHEDVVQVCSKQQDYEWVTLKY